MANLYVNSVVMHTGKVVRNPFCLVAASAVTLAYFIVPSVTQEVRGHLSRQNHFLDQVERDLSTQTPQGERYNELSACLQAARQSCNSCTAVLDSFSRQNKLFQLFGGPFFLLCMHNRRKAASRNVKLLLQAYDFNRTPPYVDDINNGLGTVTVQIGQSQRQNIVDFTQVLSRGLQYMAHGRAHDNDTLSMLDSIITPETLDYDNYYMLDGTEGPLQDGPVDLVPEDVIPRLFNWGSPPHDNFTNNDPAAMEDNPQGPLSPSRRQ
ncbi:Hypothetical protein D9617_14g075900 [Elsinoe fawcettii]|nr:Hypothetical protein D9617_14g075900 [Elsinoe fawcettii]